jgi:glucan 1,3-beta-glucosidase
MPAASLSPPAPPHPPGWFTASGRLLALVLAVAATIAWWTWIGRAQPVADATAAHFPCLSYAPFRDGQSPFDRTTVIPPQQIAADLQRLAPRSRCVRTYEAQKGLAAVVPLAETLGVKVMQGAWIGVNAAENDAEIAAVIALANQHPQAIAAVIVGNEVLLRREQSAAALSRLIGRVRAAIPAQVPVTYADVWEFWLKHPEVAGAVDFITVHTLPYWEDEPIAAGRAVPHVLDIIHRMQAAFPGKPIFIGEAGWPSTGRMRRGALPSPVNQAIFIRQLMTATADAGIGLNIVEAFDQPWKRKLEGTVGGFWGVFDAVRNPKVSLQGTVSNDPHWFRHAAVAAMLGLLLMVPAAVEGWRRRLCFLSWLALLLAGQAAATAVVAGGLAAIDASRTILDALIWGARIGLAAAVSILAPLALLRPIPAVPLPAEELITAVRARRRLRADPIRAALGWVRLAVLFGASVTTLCFLVDARYRDFPGALTLVPAAAFLLLALAARRGAPAADAAAPSDRRPLTEDRLLALVLAVGGVAIGLSEAPFNHQAWLLMAANLGLAAAVLIEPVAAPQVRTARIAASSNAAADSSAL